MAENKQFDDAFAAFHAQKFPEAIKLFEGLLAGSDLPPWQQNRVKQFKAIAEKKAGEAESVSSEDGLMGISYLINCGSFAAASAILDEGKFPEHHEAFLRAEIEALQGNMDASAVLLKKAIGLNRDNRGYALNAPTFRRHINEPAFSFLKQGLGEKAE